MACSTAAFVHSCLGEEVACHEPGKFGLALGEITGRGNLNEHRYVIVWKLPINRESVWTSISPTTQALLSRIIIWILFITRFDGGIVDGINIPRRRAV